MAVLGLFFAASVALLAVTLVSVVKVDVNTALSDPVLALTSVAAASAESPIVMLVRVCQTALRRRASARSRA